MSITRTADELSIVCDERLVPPDVRAERGFVALMVEGPVPFSATGLLASIAGPLAAAAVSLFTISTYDTDYLFVREAQIEVAIGALVTVGHRVSAA